MSKRIKNTVLPPILYEEDIPTTGKLKVIVVYRDWKEEDCQWSLKQLINSVMETGMKALKDGHLDEAIQKTGHHALLNLKNKL